MNVKLATFYLKSYIRMTVTARDSEYNLKLYDYKKKLT